ncbi:SDR family oxidoreductase [Sphingobium yanoikuyae]
MILEGQLAKTVLVTGAGSGIGWETSLRFAREGWNVVATTRRGDSISTDDLLPNMLAIPMDVTRPDQVRDAVATAICEYGTIDAVINNAGVAEFGVFEAISPERVRTSFEVNVYGVMNVMRAAVPHFRNRKAGTFVNISSAGGRVGMPAMSIYLATKFALEGFSESAWFELAALGIAVKLVEPGGVETPFLEKIARTRSDNVPPEDYADFMRHNDQVMSGLAWPRSTPKEIADIVFLAATDGSSRLRYFAGPGVAHMIDARTTLDDERYELFMRAEFAALSKLKDQV